MNKIVNTEEKSIQTFLKTGQKSFQKYTEKTSRNLGKKRPVSNGKTVHISLHTLLTLHNR